MTVQEGGGGGREKRSSSVTRSSDGGAYQSVCGERMRDPVLTGAFYGFILSPKLEAHQLCIHPSRFPILTINSGFNISLIEPNELRS